MQTISPAWLYPIILVAGALQAWGPPMNGALRKSLETLARQHRLVPADRGLLMVLWFCLPTPMPTAKGVAGMLIAVF